MSFNFIYEFQMKLYSLLNNDQIIKENIDRIYLSITQDAKYPFLFINIIKAEDASRFSYNIFNVEFEICVFARDKNQKILLFLVDKITERLKPRNCYFSGYIIAGMKAGEISFTKSQDLITTKLSLSFKALLKKEELNI